MKKKKEVDKQEIARNLLAGYFDKSHEEARHYQIWQTYWPAGRMEQDDAQKEFLASLSTAVIVNLATCCLYELKERFKTVQSTKDSIDKLRKEF